MLEHGGRLVAASLEYGLPLESWLDLSTGVSPVSYPVPAVKPGIWRDLPDEQDGLVATARAYYGVSHLLATSGSQAAIKALPFLRSRSTVAMIEPSYNEHAHAWRQCGHEVVTMTNEQLESFADIVDVIVLCNPNNPTAGLITSDRLKWCLERLAMRRGWLIVDEAFIDCEPRESMTRHIGLSGLIVLRSLGKFFGLAGARVGFVCAEQTLLSMLSEHLGPWTIAGPSRFAAQAALSDTGWHEKQKTFLRESSARLEALLGRFDLAPSGSTAYFQWVRHERAENLKASLARSAILTRYFSSPPSLRFGLPYGDSAWSRLESALQEFGYSVK